MESILLMLPLLVICAVVPVKKAMAKAGVSLKAAAIELHMDPGQLCRELETGKLNLDRLARLPRVVRQWLAIEIAAEDGLPREVVVGRMVRRVLKARAS